MIEPDERIQNWRWVAVTLLAVPSLLRALVVPSRFPWFETDPFTAPPTGTTISPTGSLILDACTVLGAGVAVMVSGQRVLWPLLLFLIGACGVLWHGSHDLENLVVAGPWIASMATLLGAWWLGRDPHLRGVLLGLGLGVVMLFFMRSLVQVLVEHPQTLRSFRENSAAVLGSRGWSPGSPQALVYERRLTQPDATAWFGLSNVLSTFAAAAAVVGILGVWRAPSKNLRWGMIALGTLGVVLLWMTGSKGGWGVFGLGLGVAMLGYWPRSRGRLNRLTPWLPHLAIVAVLLAVGVRGVLGDRLGERSLLFRAHYLEASARMLADEPLVGVGPAHYQAAYLIHKDPLNPEEITSPHSVGVDWVATLGVFGLTWVMLTLALSRWRVSQAGMDQRRALDAGECTTNAGDSGRSWASDPVVLVPLVAFAGGLWFERDLLLPEDVLARLLGFVVWVWLAKVIVRHQAALLGPVSSLGLVVVLLAHGQIEMTPILTGSAPLWGLLLGAGVAGWRSDPAGLEVQDEPSPVLWRLGGLLACLAIAAGVVWQGARVTARWEGHLRAAAMPLAELGESSRLEPESVTDEMLTAARTEALTHLARAIDERPEHLGTRIAASRLALQLATAAPEADQAEWIRSARGWIAGADLDTLPSRGLVWMSTLERLAVDQGATPMSEAAPRAIAALEQAAALDPYNARIPQQLARWSADAGDPASTRDWAVLALELDELWRLDPLRQFPDAARRELRRLSRTE